MLRMFTDTKCGEGTAADAAVPSLMGGMTGLEAAPFGGLIS